MKLKTITLHKTVSQTIKFRDNFRKVEVGLDETFELEEGEKFDFDKEWNKLTEQLRKQMTAGGAEAGTQNT